MDKVYIIYDTTNYVWDKAHRTFDLAMVAVTRRIYSENDRYKKSESYKSEATLPGKMEKKYDLNNIKAGVLVATIEDLDVKVFIKEVVV